MDCLYYDQGGDAPPRLRVSRLKEGSSTYGVSRSAGAAGTFTWPKRDWSDARAALVAVEALARQCGADHLLVLDCEHASEIAATKELVNQLSRVDFFGLNVQVTSYPYFFKDNPAFVDFCNEHALIMRSQLYQTPGRLDKPSRQYGQTYGPPSWAINGVDFVAKHARGGDFALDLAAHAQGFGQMAGASMFWSSLSLAYAKQQYSKQFECEHVIFWSDAWFSRGFFDDAGSIEHLAKLFDPEGTLDFLDGATSEGLRARVRTLSRFPKKSRIGKDAAGKTVNYYE